MYKLYSKIQKTTLPDDVALKILQKIEEDNILKSSGEKLLHTDMGFSINLLREKFPNFYFFDYEYLSNYLEKKHPDLNFVKIEYENYECPVCNFLPHLLTVDNNQIKGVHRSAVNLLIADGKFVISGAKFLHFHK